jgi:hypothetical protein
MATTKKRIYRGRNTAMFYALIAQLPGYSSQYKDLIKEGVIDEFLTKYYGVNHNMSLSLSALSDIAYNELILDLRAQVNDGKSRVRLQNEAIRKDFIHKILNTLSRIGVQVVDGDYSEVNYHILRLPISKGRTIPQFPIDELEKLLGAVRAYCGNMKKYQQKEQNLAEKN